MVPSTRLSENIKISSTPVVIRLTTSDLSFTGNIVFQGNYSGWQAYDMSNPSRPVLRSSYVCPGSQSDVSVFRNLLFVSHEATSGRVDCGLQGIPDTVTVSQERARGIRIYELGR